MGRKAIPTKLKLIRGNPGKRPVNTQEAMLPPGLPKCPAHLNKAARAEWNEKVHTLVRCGLVTQIDNAVLAAYCQSAALWADASEKLEEFGYVIKSPKGYPVQSPYLAIRNRSMEQMTRLAAELGMSSSSRARIPVPDNPADPLAKFLNRGKTE